MRIGARWPGLRPYRVTRPGWLPGADLHPDEDFMAYHRTADLNGPLLDAAVAKAQKHAGIAIREAHCYVNWHVRDGLGAGDAFSPSSAWGCGGAIRQSAGVNVLYSPT